MVATDKNKKSLHFNQHYIIYRLEKFTQLTYSARARLHTTPNKKKKENVFSSYISNILFIAIKTKINKLKLIAEYVRSD
jgi:hypothetical protein